MRPALSSRKPPVKPIQVPIFSSVPSSWTWGKQEQLLVNPCVFQSFDHSLGFGKSQREIANLRRTRQTDMAFLCKGKAFDKNEGKQRTAEELKQEPSRQGHKWIKREWARHRSPLCKIKNFVHHLERLKLSLFLLFSSMRVLCGCRSRARAAARRH